ncbi:aldo/keto reductase [Planctomicrobium sp. SH668]|uniref:aldo/keto reductase n=1 Tax=Planctomicrobium sp. SH668 TaxID=3448126 RepID=UPI003F5BE1B1
MLLRKKLGQTGLEVTQLGFGSMGLRGARTWGVRVVEDDHAERILNQVLDSGINFIDTAPDYGAAEERIGRFISHRRGEFILATKCGCDPIQHANQLEIVHVWTPGVLERNIESSLIRMRTDYIDLLQFHGGDADQLEKLGLIELLHDFQRQGVVRYLGASSSLPQLSRFIELGIFDVVQVPYSCLAPQHDAIMKQAAAQGAGVIIRGGIAQGGPDAEIQREHLNRVWNQAGLNEILPAEMTRAEFILRSTLSHPACSTTIVGTANEQHLKENVEAAMKGPLSDELVTEINRRVTAALQ